MLKLMKYEFKKQMFSKLIIVILLAASVALFAVSVILDDIEVAGAAVFLMFMIMMCSIVYVAFEELNVYDKDLKTKQSYMLFMLPQSARSILCAKLLASALQILFTIVIFSAAIGISFGIYSARYDVVKESFEFIKLLLSELDILEINYQTIFRILSILFILWVFMVMLGIFVITLVNTLLSGKRFVTLLSMLVYCLIFWAVVTIDNRLIPSVEDTSAIINNLIGYGFYLALILILFFASAWLIDRKLSV